MLQSPACRRDACVDRTDSAFYHASMSEEKVKGPASYFPSIEKKYGKPIAEWQALVRAAGPARHMELVTMLKEQHGMGHGHANAIVAHTLAEDRA